MPKTIKLEHNGWLVRGTAHITCWDGVQGTITIDETPVPLGKMTRDNLHRCINDGQFGCASIDRANLFVYEIYSDGAHEVVKNPRQILVEDPDPRLYCRGI